MFLILTDNYSTQQSPTAAHFHLFHCIMSTSLCLPNHERSSATVGLSVRLPPACLASPDVSSTRWDKASSKAQSWPHTSILQIYCWAPAWWQQTGAAACTSSVRQARKNAPEKLELAGQASCRLSSLVHSHLQICLARCANKESVGTMHIAQKPIALPCPVHLPLLLEVRTAAGSGRRA